ncbi:hypothetical protein [Streptococcus alactolyticus]|uniref:hypothetical protein n=1 Tax=Streptococcus alactolyticus TaxID=29389 RepID=UPI0039C6690E
MPKANITYKAVGNDEKAEWGDYDHLMQRWEGLSKSVANDDFILKENVTIE